MKAVADFIFKNGKVVTMNKQDDIESAIAIKGNKILGVGKDQDLEKFKGESTKEIDLNGRSLLPGFIDSHLHFTMYGMKQGPIINVDSTKVSSIAEIKEKVREAVKNKKPGEWIALTGYDQNKLKEGRHPTVEDFDEVAPNNPVRCTRCCAHLGVYNSLALEIGGISKDKFAEGEVVEENGKLTGLLKEDAHLYMGQKVVFTDEQLMEGLYAADKLMKEHGVTSVHDAGCDIEGTNRFLLEAIKKGQLKTRITIMIFGFAGKKVTKRYIDGFLDAGLVTGIGNQRFKIGPCKMMLDGSSSGPSSATREPYDHDPDLKGILVWSQEEVDEYVKKVHDAGCQVTAHAVGDQAVEIMVNSIEKALKDKPREDCRHRIEHCGIVDPKLIKRIKELGIIPVTNPSFIELNGKDYNRFYGERVKYMFPNKSYLEEGIIATMGSDAPVTLENPMLGIYGALSRKDGKTGEFVGENQRIGILDAIRMYTYNGAYAEFEEDSKGSLEVGKLADLIVLSENILETAEDDIKNVRVDMTMIDGEMVYIR